MLERLLVFPFIVFEKFVKVVIFGQIDRQTTLFLRRMIRNVLREWHIGLQG